MDFIVVAYYSKNTVYEQEVKRLITSLRKFEIPYHITPVNAFNSWYEGVQYKPRFLKDMLQQFNPHSIVYVDADAEFLQYPNLFHILDARPEVNVAAHILDHAKRGHPNRKEELLSGTLYFKNNNTVYTIIDEWIKMCTNAGQLWDQVALWSILRKYPFHVLPDEYCTIFDYMSDVENPVIRHYQASRAARNSVVNKGPLPTYETTPGEPQPIPLSRPRKIMKGGIVRYHRKWR